MRALPRPPVLQGTKNRETVVQAKERQYTL